MIIFYNMPGVRPGGIAVTPAAVALHPSALRATFVRAACSYDVCVTCVRGKDGGREREIEEGSVS